MAEASAESRPLAPSLSALLESVGVGLVQLVAPTLKLPSPVESVAIVEPSATTYLRPNSIALAVGVERGTEEFSILVKNCADAGVVAIATKVAESELRIHANSLPGDDLPALLTVRPDVDWGHLYLLLAGAIDVEMSMPQSAAGLTAADDLFTVADTLASVCGGPIVIEDMQRRVLAFSSGGSEELDDARKQAILSRRSSPELHDLYRADRLMNRLASGEVVEIPAGRYPGVGGRQVVAARIGDRVMATIWLQTTRTSRTSLRALQAGARLVALHLARGQATAGLRQHVHNELATALLEGRSFSASSAAELGLNPEKPFVVVAMRHQSPDLQTRQAAATQMTSVIQIYRQALRLTAVDVEIDGTVYLLTHTGGATQGSDAEPSDLPFGLAELYDQVRRAAGPDVCATIGRAAIGVGEVRQSRDEADLAQRVVNESPPTHVVRFQDVEAKARLISLADRLADRRPAGRLLSERVASLDETEGSEYVATLRAIFGSNLNGRAAARLLGIHPNTLRHRIGQLAQKAQVDLDDAEQRFVLELELRLLT